MTDRVVGIAIEQQTAEENHQDNGDHCPMGARLTPLLAGCRAGWAPERAWI
jgi:hypothetical protein